MTEQPKTVVCTSCSAKFLVPDELIRGKLVKFRCRKCGSVIEADGRKTARAAAVVEPRTTEVTAVDTPATFSQRTEPPPPPPPPSAPPPAPVSNNGANLHPWPEPPRPLSTAPTSISEPPEASLPRVHAMRDPSNRGPKIAAIVALLVAAGLSGVGLAMRGSPPGAASAGETTGLEGVERPYVPPGVDPAMRPGAEARRDDPNWLNRGPTRVTDLPRAAAGQVQVEDPTAAGGTIALAKPSETMNEKQEPAAGRQAINVAPAVNAAPAVPVAAPATPLANAEGPAAERTEPSAAGAPPTATANTGAATPLENGAAAAAPSAPNGPAPTAAPQVGVNPSSLPVAPPPAARAKGDFNTQAAREALEDAADRANKCKTIDTPSGNGRVAVTFAPNGHVTNAIIDSGPLVGTTAGTCVASKFRSAKVPPFSGEAVVVRKNVKF